jgi:hypothetical protein
VADVAGSDELEYLIVVRHGRIETFAEVEEVADKLAELVEEPEWRIVPWGVEHSNTPEASATAAALATALGLLPVAAPEGRRLGPPFIGSSTPAKRIASLLAAARNELDTAFDEPAAVAGANTLVVVGNQPALDWLLDQPWLRKPITLGSAEAACLVRPRGLRAPWHLWWVLTPGGQGQRALAEMRAKVSSKMTVLSVLAGFATAILTMLLTSPPAEHPQRSFVFVAAALLAAAVIVFIGSLLAYDRLLLPTHFWRTESPTERGNPLTAHPVWRPPSSASWVVYQSSVLLWIWVEWALAAAALAAALLALSAVWPIGDPLEALLVAVTAVAAPAFAVFWWRRHRPRFGYKD